MAWLPLDSQSSRETISGPLGSPEDNNSIAQVSLFQTGGLARFKVFHCGIWSSQWGKVTLLTFFFFFWAAATNMGQLAIHFLQDARATCPGQQLPWQHFLCRAAVSVSEIVTPGNVLTSWSSFLEVVAGRQLGQEGMFPARYGGGGCWELGWGVGRGCLSHVSVSDMSPAFCQSLLMALQPPFSSYSCSDSGISRLDMEVSE